ncbi:MAG: hypothetical protein K9M57_11520 [Phycisphaerae bacterium]|nr:hypothetical protein [Phycisphaerae bacterium]
MSKSRIICSVVLVLAFIVLFLDTSDDSDMSAIDFSSVTSPGGASLASQEGAAVLAIPSSLRPTPRTPAIGKSTVSPDTIEPAGTRKGDIFTASRSFVHTVALQASPEVEPEKSPVQASRVSMTFRLSAILVGQATRIAMINNQPMTPGGTIGPFTLVEVKTASALLSYEHRHYELEINEPRTIELLPEVHEQ